MTSANLSGDEPISVHKVAAYFQVSHEMLVDSGTHQCDESCPPPYVPPPVPWPEQVRRRLRSVWWRIERLAGYRLAHKDDIRTDDDW